MSLSQVAALALLAASPALGAAVARAPGYTVNVGTVGVWKFADDTPGWSFLDKDGSYHLQQSHSLYSDNESREWNFFTGNTIDDVYWDYPLSKFVNPANPLDSNGNTTWRCNNSPTGKIATYAPRTPDANGKAPYPDYSQKNFCDLIGVWVDPDTGDWYGLIRELDVFSGHPYGDALHFDRIDYAISKDQGQTWNIVEGILSTPYGNYQRGDNVTFPGATYSWGAGDQRLVVDVASGYFYINYYSRIIDKYNLNIWKAFYAHAARAPISSKFAAGSWQKWYNGAWSEPGLGGRESGIIPVVNDGDLGYTPPAKDYNPKNLQTADQQIALGLTPPTTPLFWMDASYNPYLGQWVGQPNAVDTNHNVSQQFYGSADLTTQKWKLLGDSGPSYKTMSQYRWFIDSASKTSGHYIGKNFRGYCSFGCSTGNSEYVNLNIEPSTPTPSVIDTNKTYKIVTAAGIPLTAGGANDKWTSKANGDGSYSLTNVGTGKELGTSDQVATRAWGTPASLGAAGGQVGHQWWIIPGRSAKDNSLTGTFRLVNSWSGLVLAITSSAVELVPPRSWTDVSGSKVGGGRKAEQQTFVFTAV
ncbi:uncharacterized protein LOC62_02G001922 [Vanrija pseudolonga]|uniref:Ricin B lectin domain-containing protein n=1 Tax=Vanrija pseudolonga TaxID=143232 RepID=A0AAF1BJH5_9TREE|nr:hypothetical protein LOC62_02G001922 [Vanrija pseudolonga]